MKLVSLLILSVPGKHAVSSLTASHPGSASYLGLLSVQFAGTIHILDDCTFQVTGFTYDGQAPNVGWYGAKNVASIECALCCFKLTITFAMAVP